MAADPRRRGLVGLGMLGAVLASVAMIAVETGSPEPRQRPDAVEAEAGAAARSASPFRARPPFAGSFPEAIRAARTLRAVNPRGAAALERIARQPRSYWLGPGYSPREVKALVSRVTAAAARERRTPVFVTYALPARDCTGHSAGGLAGKSAYQAWSRAVAAGIKGRPAAFVVEPDGLAMLGDCRGQGNRTALLAYQVKVLSNAGAVVYLDAGHSNWKSAPVMAARLKAAGVGRARGFAVNVANFGSTASERRYAERLSALLGGKHYVIDTSRNGRGRGAGWCNPAGRALGATPRAVTGSGHLDAYLWIKTPGLSDGRCNGGPAAGKLWVGYAIGLARRAGW